MESKLNLSYKISKDDWMKGYDLYFKMFKRRSMIIKAGIFAVTSLLFIDQIVKDPSNTTGWLCFIVCIAMVAMILMNSRIERKNMMRALDGIVDDTYVFDLFDDSFTVKTIVSEKEENLEYDEEGNIVPLPDIEPSVCYFNDRGLRCIETSDIYAVFSYRGCFFIPKAELSDSQNGELKNSLTEALGNKYREKL